MVEVPLRFLGIPARQCAPSSRSPDVRFVSITRRCGPRSGWPISFDEPLECRMIVCRRLDDSNQHLTVYSAARRSTGGRRRNRAKGRCPKARERSRVPVEINEDIPDVIDAEFDDLGCEPEVLLQLANQI